MAAIALFALLTPLSALATDRDVGELTPRERIFLGGSLGFQFGTFNTTLGIHLHGGYLVTNRLMLGVGGNYQYMSFSAVDSRYTSHIYGAGAFARYAIVAGFFAHAEFERLNLQSSPPEGEDPGNRPRITENNYLVGAGYTLGASSRVRLNLMLLYNLNDSSQVYYENPFFRVGVDVFIF